MTEEGGGGGGGGGGALAEKIEALARLLAAAERPVVFTGAGVSTESGIPDFRGPDGLWTRFQPVYYQEFVSDPEARRRYWELKRQEWRAYSRAEPNAAHRALAELERLGRLRALITQNIDGLHQIAGSSPERVIELHGTARRVSCLECGRSWETGEIMKRVDAGEEAPLCTAPGCKGLLKPAVISFGQAMPVAETERAAAESAAADLFIVVGSSLVVQPAAQMPLIARQAGARLVIANLSETPLDEMAELLISAKAGEVLPGIARRLGELLGTA